MSFVLSDIENTFIVSRLPKAMRLCWIRVYLVPFVCLITSWKPHYLSYATFTYHMPHYLFHTSIVLGSCGALVEVLVGERNQLEFYTKLGFFELPKTDFTSDDSIYLGRAIWIDYHRKNHMLYRQTKCLPVTKQLYKSEMRKCLHTIVFHTFIYESLNLCGTLRL